MTREFLKKYLSFVKSHKNPELDEECIEYASQLYSFIRGKAVDPTTDQNKVSTPVTVRSLETIIRLATAHAKLRMSKSIETKDIDVATNLIHLSIFGKSLTEEEDDMKKKRVPDQEMADEAVDLNQPAQQQHNAEFQRSARNRRAMNRTGGQDKSNTSAASGPGTE